MRLYFFGDSICFGQFVSPNKIWVNDVAVQLDRLLHQLVVQNPSVNGRTTRQALEDMPYQVQAHQPDAVYVQFGMNDCNQWVSDNGHTRVSVSAFEANLAEIVSRARLAGAKSVLLGTNHPTPRTTPYNNIPGVLTSYQDSNRVFNEATRRVAAAHSVPLVDNEAHWLARGFDKPEALGRLVLSDGVHLSEDGHRVYAEFVGRVLADHLAGR